MKKRAFIKGASFLLGARSVTAAENHELNALAAQVISPDPVARGKTIEWLKTNVEYADDWMEFKDNGSQFVSCKQSLPYISQQRTMICLWEFNEGTDDWSLIFYVYLGHSFNPDARHNAEAGSFEVVQNKEGEDVIMAKVSLRDI